MFVVINTEPKCSESESHSVVSDSLRLPGLYSPWKSPGQNTELGSLSLLQEISPTQELNPGLPHLQAILYQLSYKGNLRILERVAYPFSRDLPDPGVEWGSPALQVDSLPTELWGKQSALRVITVRAKKKDYNSGMKYVLFLQHRGNF